MIADNPQKSTVSQVSCPSQSPPDLVPLPCRACGTIDVPQITPGKGPHAFAGTCAHCGAFIQWVSQFTDEERRTRRDAARLQAMAQKPPSQAQLDWLTALGDTKAPPLTMAAASERIDALVRGEVQP